MCPVGWSGGRPGRGGRLEPEEVGDMGTTGSQASDRGEPETSGVVPGSVAAAEPDDGLVLRYPPPYWLAALWCHALLLGLTVVACPPSATGKLQEAYLVALVCWAVAAVVVAVNPIRRLLGRARVEPDGLRVRGLLAPWGSITRLTTAWHEPGSVVVHVRPGSLVRRRGPGRPQSPPSWPRRLIGARRRRISLSAYPVVCGRLLPETLRRAPEAETTPGVRRLMGSPGLGGAPAAWLVLACAWAQLAVLASQLTPFGAQSLVSAGLAPRSLGDALLGLCVGPVMLIAGLCAVVLAVPLARDGRAAFLRSALASVGIAGMVSQMAVLAQVDVAPLRALWATSMAAALAAVVVALLGAGLQRRAEVVLALAVLATALVASRPPREESWPRQDMTHLFGSEPGPVLVWGRDGRHVAERYTDRHLLVIDVSTPTQVPGVAATDGFVLWLDERRMLRAEQDEGGRGWARLLDFRTGEQFRLPRANESGVAWDPLQMAFARPICPEGRRLAWHETREGCAVLRVWDMETRRDAVEPLPLPDDRRWSGAEVVWGDEDRVALVAYEDTGQRTRRPDVLVVDLRTGAMRSWSSQHRYQRWRFSVDLARAVAEGPDGSAYRVDLASDEAVLLPGEGLVAHPSPLRDAAYRVVKQNRDHVLARVDLVTGEPTVVCPVPPGWALAAVSDSGTLALLTSATPFREVSQTVVHLPTGRTYTVPLLGFAPGPHEYYPSWADLPGLSPFSPHDDRLLLAAVSLVGPRVWLVDIPEEWRGAGTPAPAR
jgi:hypothetical protein